VSGHFHNPATLSALRERAPDTHQIGGCVGSRGSVWTFWRRDKSLVPVNLSTIAWVSSPNGWSL